MALAALAYGFLASFVLSAANHNHRHKKQHSVALLRLGYLLCGLSAGTSAVLSGVAISQLV